jgi:DNA-directed RNA polymerase specialized sigma24 family protein
MDADAGGLDEFTTRFIKAKARQMIGKAKFRKCDLDDIEAELIGDLLARLSRFDPSRGNREVFVVMVVKNKSAEMIRTRLAPGRDVRRCTVSLNDVAKGENRGTEEISAGFDSKGYIALGGHAPGDPGSTDLAIDMERLLDALPPDLRRTCEELMKTNPSEAARSLGIGRGKLLGQLDRIRKEMRALRIYR